MALTKIPAAILSSWQRRVQMALIDTFPTDLATAYDLQDQLVDLIERDGGVISGGKIGLGDPRIIAALGLEEPVSGLLFDHMRIQSGRVVSAPDHLQPRVEGELCMTLAADLDRDDLSLEDVTAAIETVAPAIEIVDSRWKDWGGSVPAAVAENVSASYYVCGNAVAMPERLEGIVMRMTVDDQTVATGTADAAYGSPLKALQWLACNLARRGRPLRQGNHVMSGAWASMQPVAGGQHVAVEFSGIGAAEVTFE